MSKLITNEVRTFGMINKYRDRANEYLISVSDGDLYMKETEEGAFSAVGIRENADIHVGECQQLKVPKWRMLISKWSITTALNDTTQFHIMEI